ncbi:MAG: phosphopantetheine-binding protein [Lachnospiraceae bacterium]|nr:phosphopantetheine-binding protein [Lachnospiraceae bacterium]
MEEFIEKLKLIKKGVDFENETELFDGGFLDSFDVIQIITMLDEDYEITVPPSEIVPTNFNSAKAMFAMMQRLEDE